MYPLTPLDTASTEDTPIIPIEPAKQVKIVLALFDNKFLADNLKEVKSVCKCGRKASVNARFVNGKISVSGAEILRGAEECYEGMCYLCYRQIISNQNKNE